MSKSAILFLNGFHRVFQNAHRFNSGKTFCTVSLTQQEVATALRPFYFAVHPDLLWQYPKEKEINENSLKLLNSHLEILLKNQPTSPLSVTFCLRNTTNVNPPSPKRNTLFKKVHIQLTKDLRNTVHEILSVCQISTKYVEDLPKLVINKNSNSQINPEGNPRSTQPNKSTQDFWFNAEDLANDIQARIRKEPITDFRVWLYNNVTEARRRLDAIKPLREETERHCKELKEKYELRDIIWNCGWGISHFRGCLQSFRALTIQHPKDMAALKNRTIVFGRETGVSFEGHIILSSEDVRNNWHDMIHSMDQYDSLLRELPNAEKQLSDVLRGIVVDHRKFQPTVMVEKYIHQLGKLRTALYKYKWHHGYPELWPRRLENFQIVVECEAGPLMLSPTGQFIVPASCPAFLLVEFISKNMETASQLREQYTEMKQKELEVYTKCMTEFGLEALDKDDNVTPDLMVKCCERLLEQSNSFSRLLRDLRLTISHYYSILQDGDVCIPWDWKRAI